MPQALSSSVGKPGLKVRFVASDPIYFLALKKQGMRKGDSACTYTHSDVYMPVHQPTPDHAHQLCCPCPSVMSASHHTVAFIWGQILPSSQGPFFLFRSISVQVAKSVFRLDRKKTGLHITCTLGFFPCFGPFIISTPTRKRS